mgnify:CR=1 FL=1
MGSEMCIRDSLNPTLDMIAKADEYRQKYFYGLDGKASIRFVEKMEELYSEGGHENGV